MFDDERRLANREATRDYNFGSSGMGPSAGRISALERARQSYLELGQPVDAAWCDLDLGIVLGSCETPDLDRALRQFGLARDIFFRHDVTKGFGMAVAKIANLLLVQGRQAEALAELARLDGIHILDPSAIAAIAGVEADLAMGSGDWLAVLAALERKLDAHQQARRTRDLPKTLTSLGHIALRLDRVDDAESYADRATALLDETGNVDTGTVLRLRAAIAEKRGRAIEAIAHIEAGLAVATRWRERVDLLMNYGRLAGRAGHTQVAIDRYDEALLLVGDKQPGVSAQIHDGLARMRRSDDGDAAFTHASDALRASDAKGETRRTVLVRRLTWVVSDATNTGRAGDCHDEITRLEQELTKVGDLRGYRWSLSCLAEAKRHLGDELGARRVERAVERGTFTEQ